METKSSFQDNRSGMTLVVVMVLTMLCTIAVASVLYTVGAQTQRAYKQVHMEQAFYVAEAGMERAAAWVAADNEDSITLTGEIGGGSYETTVTVSNLSGGVIDIEVISTGTVNGTSRTVTVHGLQRLSWARYALWYDREALELNIAAGDIFTGRFYSRPQLRFSNPTPQRPNQAHFYDRAWTGASSAIYNEAKPIFDFGLTLNAERQEISEVKFSDLKAAAHRDGLVLEGDATIELDGKNMKITNLKNEWDEHIYTIPENGIVYAQARTYEESYYYWGRWRTRTVTEPGDINVSGPNGLDGKLTLVAERHVNIIDHIRYADNPKENPNSDDKLGLIAGKNAVVKPSAPNNVEIFAHIFCRDGGFGVEDYNQGPHRGMLHVYGGIANLIRNAVGIVNGAGFLKDYQYDPRFARDPPPYYPRLTDVLAWDGWEG